MATMVIISLSSYYTLVCGDDYCCIKQLNSFRNN